MVLEVRDDKVAAVRGMAAPARLGRLTEEWRRTEHEDPAHRIVVREQKRVLGNVERLEMLTAALIDRKSAGHHGFRLN